ncbi:TIM-barrel domain-containing protein [Pedobacter sp. Du54]|uniref:glycoside hydrolase family 31 protein n=1 Tax=Pedobacter anseongensis TaxID=3133439 RepID=UPI0030AF0BE3
MKQLALLLLFLSFFKTASAQQIEKVAPGVWKITYGTQEEHKPSDFKEEANLTALQKLANASTSPISLADISFKQTAKGVLAELKMEASERIYGFGLQVNTFEQRGLRREMRTNSWTVGNVGFSHAPMPFYISSKGYGVLINTARYTTFYMGSQHKLEESINIKKEIKAEANVETTTAALYKQKYKSSNDVEIIIDGAKGMEMLIFEGPTMKNVIERYNLYSGGGSLPPLWGLGLKYRAKGDFGAKEVINFSKYFRENKIPCDMFGLEPGWQSASYSCSYTWNDKNFPNPDSLLNVMHGMNYKLSLWEHAYVHPTSPIFDAITPYSGDYAVWKGAVPDFVLPKARSIFGDYHNTNFIKKGISGFKLDESDGAYYHEANAEWSFPDIAKFPSGVDGTQMRQLLGLTYSKTILDEYRKENKRTMLEVRASYLFASPHTSALYTDMYNHADFVRMIANSGFAGVNWSPEVRQTKSDEDLIRRLQTILMSSHMVVDCWFLKNLPWFQYDRDKNNNGIALPNYKELEAKAKKLIELRMRLIPYLYASFAKYKFEGTPPFRALVVDFPDEVKAWRIDNQYMMGDQIMCAPFIDGASTRKVYFPTGIWYDFNTNKKYEGGQSYSITMSLDEIPMFIKSGTILPLAKPVEFITPGTVFEINCKVYGTPTHTLKLLEDDSYTLDYEKGRYGWAELSWDGKKGKITRSGNYWKKMYTVQGWERIE